ncbi:MAG TPA: hypothetical protein DCR27_01095 [Lachnospiraceae bacterium]|nr:hypothetical protein [Lachnospiraceae bacterium]
MERQETGEPGEPAIPGAFGKTGQETGMDIPEEVPQDGSQDAPEAEVPAKVKFIQTDDRSGLPQEVCSVIDAINAGEDLKTATGLDTVEEYCALTAVHIILAVDPKTEEETTGSGRLQMYVPNLLAGLEDVSGLFFDRGTAEWSVIPVDFADAAGKRVAVTVPGSGALTIVYRKGQ